MTTQHTPGPYFVKGGTTATIPNVHILAKDESCPAGVYGIATVYGDTKEHAILNAKTLVNAFNSHDELVKVLKDVANDLAWGTTAKYKGEGSKFLFDLIARAGGQ